MSRRNKTVGYSRKYASAMKSFDRSASRVTRSLSRAAFSSKKRNRSKATSPIGDGSSNWENVGLTTKQLIVSCIVGMLFPVMSLAGMNKAEGITGTLLLVLFFFFAIPFFAMALIFTVFNTITRPKTKCNTEQNCVTEEASEVNEPVQLYVPNSEWMGDMSLINSRQNAQLIAPQLVKQIRDSGKILESTTELETFFTRYDFCIGRLKLLKECQKYGVPSENTNEALRQMLTLTYRDDVVCQMIRRAQEKYRAKIESLKTIKAKKNWADKFHLAFEPYLFCMSDAQKSALGEASAELYSLTEVPGDLEKDTT